MPIRTLDKDQFALFTHHDQRQDPHIMLDGTVGNSDPFGFKASNASSTLAYPSHEVYDMLGTCTLTTLETYDLNGSPIIQYYYSTTGVKSADWIKIGADITLSGYGSWNVLNVNIPNVRYIKRVMVTDQGRNFDIRITTTDDVIERTIPSTPARNKVNPKDSIGINGFQWEPRDKHAEVGSSVRIFFRSDWIVQGDKTKFRFSPAYSGALDLKEQVRDWNTKGVKVILVLQDTPAYVGNNRTSSFDINAKPKAFVADGLIALSWEDYADMYEQLAIYLGNGGVSSSLLTMDEGQPTYDPNIREANLNTNFCFEIWGEQDKWWSTGSVTGNERHFSPEEYFVMSKHIYDKVKAVDSNIEVWMGGYANTSPQYFKATLFLARANYSNQLPFDAINYHFYPSDGAFQDDTNGTRGVSPEAYNFYSKLNELIILRDKYCPTLKFVNSEYGYDTSMSKKRAQFSGINSAGTETIQSAWLIRCLLNMIALNVDVTHVFWFADQNGVSESSTADFFKSGLCSSEITGFVPKKSFYALKKVYDLVKGKNYLVEQESIQVGTSYVYLKDTVTKKHLIFAWRGTENITSETQTFADTLTINTIPYISGATYVSEQLTTGYGDIGMITPVISNNQISSLNLLINEAPVFVEITEGLEVTNNSIRRRNKNIW